MVALSKVKVHIAIGNSMGRGGARRSIGPLLKT